MILSFFLFTLQVKNILLSTKIQKEMTKGKNAED